MLRYFAIAAVIAAAPAAAVTAPSALYVFGDSLVDAGNIDAAVGSDQFNPRAAGYAPGRFTNGPDYTDLLSQNLYGSYLTPSLLGGTNFAFGGARIVNDGDAVPDLALQLGAYYQASKNSVDPTALYIINDGGNDVFGLEQGKIGSFTPAAYTTALLDTLAGTIQSLAAHGASRILVTGIPNIDATGSALDQQVQARLDAIQPGLGGTQLIRFSYQNFFTQLVGNPAAFGVTPFTQTGNCIGNRPVVNGNIDCTGYFSFDGIHPTAQVQEALYRQILGTTGLDTVPEPASWALMITGFGIVGAMMRRRIPAVA